MDTIQLLFKYNWEIRHKWFDWAKQLSKEELLQKHHGGLNSILRTLFHIVDVEQRWIARLEERTEIRYNFEEFQALDKVMDFSKSRQVTTEAFLNQIDKPELNKKLNYINGEGNACSYYYLEVLNHMIAHEIHHVGQLSIWSRELNKEPVSANLIGLNLYHECDK